MDLMARCREHGWSKVAFIGATKHAGKTTALNGLVEQAHRQGVTVGLCSIGLDGERLDTILGVDKPSVYAPGGTIVISAEAALEQSTAELEWLEVLPVESPLGSVVVCKVMRGGNVVLAGIRQRAHVELAMPCLLHYGAQLRLVDGAFDRIASASPELVDAVVLAVGAVAGKTVSAVLQHAQPFLQRFLLPEVDEGVRAKLMLAHKQQVIGWLSGTRAHVTAQRGALFGITTNVEWTEDVDAVYLPGAVTDSVVSELLSHSRSLTVIAQHPAQVLVHADAYRKLYRAGHRLCVWSSLPILAVACNPHSITGYDLPRQPLLDGLRALVGNIPVYDPLHDDENVSLQHLLDVGGESYDEARTRAESHR